MNMNIVTWVIQILVGGMFLFVGFYKGFTPNAELATQMAWVGDVPGWMPKLAGFAEILGGLGLILPSALRIRPELTTYAGYALALVMVFAIILHVSRGGMNMLLMPLVLGGLAAFVGWARAKKVPIAAKS